MQVEAWEESQR